VSWAPLHVHSQFSILDSLASVDEIAQRASDYGMPAVALTDHGNLYGAVDFFQACKKAGVRPIIGCELYVAHGDRRERSRPSEGRVAYHLTLLAKNEKGYQNLCTLSSLGFLEGFYYYPRVDRELLEKHSEGLVCLSGCLRSRISYTALNGTREQLLEEVRWHCQLYGDDFYLELQRHPMTDEQMEQEGFFQESWLAQSYTAFREQQDKVNGLLVEIGKEEGIPIVATNDSHYMDRDQWKAHEVLLNVQSGEPCEIWETDSLGQRKNRVPNPKRRTYESHEHYFKSPEQMAELFADLPEAISNTLEVAEKCNFAFDLETKHYPQFTPPDEEHTAESFLKKLCEEGIEGRYTKERLDEIKERFPDRDPMEMVVERLDRELSVIIPKGMCDYLLIVWDFIHWAKTQDIPVGPGRGSGAGSIVLYLIGVTDIEPLRFGLFFERFINPERISYPDIDVDICMERRGEVIDYCVQKYGKDCVAQIITFGTMKAKMVVRDVGRVLNVPLKDVDRIAKLIPDDLGMTLERALEMDPDLLALYQNDSDARRIIDYGRQLEGSIRSTGTHAAGVIITGEPLMENIPVCTAKDSDMAVTQYSMKPVEKVGMLKMDFLGLKTLTCIRMACDAVGGDIDPLKLSLDDKRAFELISHGKTLGVFQMESGGMQDLGRSLHVDRFEEIIAVGALYRPGPMDMIPSFCARKHGTEPIEYVHEQLHDILDETYGIMVYQEQVMQIAQELAGYSLGEGDVLRKAMGKKILAEMAAQREKFVEGAIANGIEETIAIEIFDQMEKFAAYGFNKSHATCYGFLTYVTAYLKANYPREWMAALMTCDRADTGKIARWIRESASLQIEILPPDVNEAGASFVATPGGIRFAMSGIKGVGLAVVEAIVEERQKSGPFKGLSDFLERVDARRAGKKVVELLIDAGSFDSFGWTRDQLRLFLLGNFDRIAKEQKESRAGVMSLFSLIEEEKEAEAPVVAEPTPKQGLLARERELLGFYLTGHPMDDYKERMQRLACMPLGETLALDDGALVRTACIVDTVATRIAQRTGRKFAILTISEGLESYEMPVWSDLFEEKGELLREGQLLYLIVQIDRQSGAARLQCRWFDDLTAADERMIEACDRAYDKEKMRNERRQRRPQKEAPKVSEPKQSVAVVVNVDEISLLKILELKALLRENSGSSSYTLRFESEGKLVGSVEVGSDWGVDSTPKLLSALNGASCVLSAKTVS